MSNPQYAAEPSMEDILASIRKMITNDRPGPSPLPDQMARTPFGERAQASPAAEANVRASDMGRSPVQTNGGQPASFNSLADALKVATALSDQRRSLQQEIANVIEKGPHGLSADALGEASTPDTTSTNVGVAGLHALPNAGSSPAPETSGPRLPNFPDWRGESATGATEAKRELLSFDFGTVVPQRENETAKVSAPAAEPAKPVSPQPSPTANASNAGADKPKSKAEPQAAEENRVLNMPTRASSALNGSSLNGSGAHGSGLNGSSLNGTAAHGSGLNGTHTGGASRATVAPFPRPVREPAKSAAEAASAPADEARNVAKSDTSAPNVVVTTTTPAPTAQPAAEANVAETEAAAAHTEALLDAVVDLVHQQPGALSVFTSGASFIGGVVEKTVAFEKTAVADNPVAPPKMDRAAAELLRPMLRQWLADNMPRIVEEALRSELTEQTQGDGKGPGNA
jgi:cell pole-organizing protein PopZ